MSKVTRSTLIQKAALAALAYTFIEATIAVIGRRVLLTDVYANADFFDTVEPSLGVFIYGMSIHLVTGILVSVLFTRLWVAGGSERPASPRNYAIVMGLLHWVLVVYGYLGRHHIENIGLFLGLEGLFTALTFTFYALVLKRIFKG